MPKTVLVTGASGFVGRSVTDALLKYGYSVKALVRSEHANVAEHPHFKKVIGDVRDIESLKNAMKGVTYVVHCAARKNDERDSEEVNVGGAMNLIEACKDAGVERIVNISTQSAKLEKKGTYGRTKAEADRLFHASPVPVVTLRSSLVYGDTESGIFATLIRYSKLPFIPMFGSGEIHFRPIHRDDLAMIIVHALEAPLAAGKMFDVGGPDLISFNDITTMLLDAQGIERRIVHLPVWLGMFAARVFSILPHPPITISNILGSTVNVPMERDSFMQTFWTVPMRSLAEGLLQLFGPVPNKAERQARLLLSYVLSSVGQWTPEPAQIELFQRACRTHRLEQLLDDRITRSRFSPARYDAASRILCPHSLLQKKLLIAAAIAETQPASADVLLPRDHAKIFVIMRVLDLGMSGLLKILAAIPLLLSPSRLKRHAGAV